VLSNVSIAFWLQDDGSLTLKNQSKNFDNFKFHTEGFSVDDIERLIEKLKTLGVESQPLKTAEYIKIRLVQSQFRKIADMAAPNVHATMKYKIDIEERNRTSLITLHCQNKLESTMDLKRTNNLYAMQFCPFCSIYDFNTSKNVYNHVKSHRLYCCSRCHTIGNNSSILSGFCGGVCTKLPQKMCEECGLHKRGSCFH
jgi:hypothetical protein